MPDRSHLPEKGVELDDVQHYSDTSRIKSLSDGVYWIGHAIQFHYIVRADRPLMVRTVLFLLFVSIVPFSAAYLGGHQADRYAIAIYCVNLAACGIALVGTPLYATRDPLMLHEVMDRRIFRGIRAAYLGGPIMYMVAFLVSFASTTAAFVICVAVPILTFFPNPFWGRVFARFAGNRAAAEEEARLPPQRDG